MTNHGAEELIEPMFELGRETMALPFDEKMKFWQGNSGGDFGFVAWSCLRQVNDLISDGRYKATGATTVDLNGSKDNAEMMNISKDDALVYPQVAHVPYPEPINARMQSDVKSFISACMEANDTLLGIFNDKLGLPKGTLGNLHSLEEHSFSEARIIKVPASPGSTNIAVGSHTDFGSLVSIWFTG